ncbi:MAG: hypothetical protein MJ188_07395 [Treponema sp.]|nr:hypothetical protein [Treponema sp.]
MKYKIFFILILILGGVAFYFGWTQIQVKTDECAIVQSKFKGVNETPVVPGKFSWNWEFLIPKNASLTKFKIKPFNTTKKISGNYQSYDLNGNYSDLLNYYFNFSISFSYTPEALVSLFQDNLISNNEDLNQYLENAADYICQLAADYYLRRSQMDSSFNPESVKRDELVAAIASYKDFPELDINIFALTDFKLPNYNIYNMVKYQGIYNSKRDSASENAANENMGSES